MSTRQVTDQNECVWFAAKVQRPILGLSPAVFKNAVAFLVLEAERFPSCASCYDFCFYPICVFEYFHFKRNAQVRGFVMERSFGEIYLEPQSDSDGNKHALQVIQ